MLISVCMATYNAGPYLHEQLDSILTQDTDGNQLEVIISDDGSTDGTRTVVESFHDPRIRFVEHTTRRRYHHYNSLRCATSNFENAMRLAKGDIIFLSDQDDVWYKGRISQMSKQLLNGGGKSLVISSFQWFYGDHKIFGDDIARPLSLWRLLRRSGVYGFSMAFTREFRDYALPIPAIHQHDTYLAALAVRAHAAVWDETVTAGHRWYKEQTSNSGFSEPLWVKVLFKLRMAAAVLLRTGQPRH